MFSQLFVLILAISFGAAFGAAFGAGTAVKKCSGNKPFPLEVRVLNCEVPPCDVVKGKDMEFEIDFFVLNDTTRMKTLVRATTMGITVPYELPDEVSNVCSNLKYGAYCPLYPTEDVTYKFIFPVSQIYPEINVKIEISIVDQTKQVVTCFTCDIRVRKGRSDDILLERGLFSKIIGPI